MTHQLAS